MSETAKRALITGGAGFIGCHLARRLSADGLTRVVLVDNLRRGVLDDDLRDLLARPNVELIRADLTDPAAYAGFGESFDEVYHLAAVVGVRNVMERPYEVLRINAQGTMLLLDWFLASGSRRLLFSSTSEAYAWTRLFHPLAVPTPEDVPLALTDLGNPRAVYAGSKILGELAVTHACRSAGRPFVIARYHNVYGPRMGYSHVVPELFQRAAGGTGPLTVYSPDHRRAFCHVSDAIGATLHVMRSEAAAGSTVNIGNDRCEVSIGELAGLLLRLEGLDRPIVGKDNPDDPITRRCPDISRLRSLGFEPSVSLEDGLRDTLAWYRSRVAP
jgi:UDP-glucose 4-epimerase/UDP-glucuronate decarboxylase